MILEVPERCRHLHLCDTCISSSDFLPKRPSDLGNLSPPAIVAYSRNTRICSSLVKRASLAKEFAHTRKAMVPSSIQRLAVRRSRSDDRWMFHKWSGFIIQDSGEHDLKDSYIWGRYMLPFLNNLRIHLMLFSCRPTGYPM